MIKKVNIFKDLPIEEGKIYKTRFQTGELFRVTKVIKKQIKSGDQLIEKILGYEGMYLLHKHLGICPLAVGRLIPEQIKDGHKYVCDCCGNDINLETFIH